MSAGAFEDDGDAVIEMDLLPPRWIDVQDEVTGLLAEISQKSAKLEKLHQKHVLPGFDDEDVRREEEAAIERMTQEITKGFHDCQRAIQRVEMMVRDAKQQGGVSKGDETMARNIQISLASRVQEVSAGFRKKQSTYLKSTPRLVERYMRYTEVSCRTAELRRSSLSPGSILHPVAESLHWPIHGRVGDRQILLSIHASANVSKAFYRQQRSHFAARARDY